MTVQPRFTQHIGDDPEVAARLRKLVNGGSEPTPPANSARAKPVQLRRRRRRSSRCRSQIKAAPARWDGDVPT